MKNYRYRSKHLFEVMQEAGISKSPQSFLMRKMREGKFSPPQDPITEGKSKNNKPWKFTADQLVEIAKAFSPGGKGEWHFKE